MEQIQIHYETESLVTSPRELNDKEELVHFMQCRLGDSCDRCKRFLK